MFKWFAEKKPSYNRCRFLHFPVRFNFFTGYYITVLFPFCLIAMIYFIIKDVISGIYFDVFDLSKHIQLSIKRRAAKCQKQK